MNTISRPALLEHLEDLLYFISSCCEDLHFTEDRREHVRLASAEALALIMNYGYAHRTGDVNVACTTEEPDRFVVEVLDTASPIDIYALKEHIWSEDTAEDEEGSLSVFLIRKLADEVHYRIEPGQNVLRLVFGMNPGPGI